MEFVKHHAQARWSVIGQRIRVANPVVFEVDLVSATFTELSQFGVEMHCIGILKSKREP